MSIDESRGEDSDLCVGTLSGEDVAAHPDGEMKEKRYKANPDFIIRNIAGEILAVPTGKTAHEINATMILTESGALLWEYLSKHTQTKADLVNVLQETYDVEPATAAQDVSCFLEKALNKRVIYQM